MEIPKELKEQITEALKEIPNKVKLILFTSEKDCEFCADAKQIANLVKESSDKISLEMYDLEQDKEKAKEYKIDMVPAFILHADELRLIRYFGLPAGHEFSTFVSDIRDISRGKPDIRDELIEKAKKIDKELHIQVFVTPTCPYCPKAVKVVHDLALLNPKITGDMIESMEFRDLAMKNNVSGVPKTIINGKVEFTGAMGIEEVLKKIEDME
jgi:glutaredoxin-like protein